jgi:RsiW-degrading membrane proteinase PrsW (M82 family)
VVNLLIFVWAVIPPLLLLWFYYHRTPAAPNLFKLLLFLIVGAIAGVIALGLEYSVEFVANRFLAWQQLQRLLWVQSLRQLLVIAPIEEGCKLAAAFAPICYFQRRYSLRTRTVFLLTIAVALGFTVEENFVYLYHNTSQIIDRLIGTPVHAMFSAPWGYALGVYISSKMRKNRQKHLLPLAWLNSVCCHALVNVLSIAWGYPRPWHFWGYGLFPLLLWLFWRLEQYLRRAQERPPIRLISGLTIGDRYWQRGLIVFSLILGGNSLFGIFILVKKLLPLHPSKLLAPDLAWVIAGQLLLNLVFASLAWLTYRYLRKISQKSYFSNSKT